MRNITTPLQPDHLPGDMQTTESLKPDKTWFVSAWEIVRPLACLPSNRVIMTCSIIKFIFKAFNYIKKNNIFWSFILHVREYFLNIIRI